MLVPQEKYYTLIRKGTVVVAGSFVCHTCKDSDKKYKGNKSHLKEGIEYGVHGHKGNLFCDEHYEEFGS